MIDMSIPGGFCETGVAPLRSEVIKWNNQRIRDTFYI